MWASLHANELCPVLIYFVNPAFANFTHNFTKRLIPKAQCQFLAHLVL